VADVLFLGIFAVFFALMVALVRWCEHIVGADDATDAPPVSDVSDAPASPAPEEVPA